MAHGRQGHAVSNGDPRATGIASRLLEEWQEARAQLRALEHAEHPDVTDRHGRRWAWVSGDLYSHDDTLAFPLVMLEELELPRPGLADENPNYARLCDTCRHVPDYAS